MITRDLASQIKKAASWSPSITVTGPRQSGKTTLCRATLPDHPYRSLEAPDDRAFAIEDPRAFLAQFPDGAVIDEVQRVPDLLSYLQGAIDDDPAPGRWVLSGSQNLALIASVSQSLAGRTALHQLLPLSWNEVGRFPNPPATLEEALLSGGYPRIFDQKLDPSDWLRSYVGTYIERDVRAISNVDDLGAFQRFLALCAGRTGQLLNYSSLADDCGITQPSAKSWFSILEASFVAFHLPVFSGKIRKRLIKMPKLYFYDSGLACWLLGIREPEQLVSHPLRGALFETWVVSEVLKHRTHRGETRGLSYYRERGGGELDLVVDDPNGVTLIEAKSAKTPSSSLFDGARRVRSHLDDVGTPSEVVVVYGGDEYRRNSDGSRLVPWQQVHVAAATRDVEVGEEDR
ncbi:MAG: ATP-binding protein [Gammaproteobacteria bacterium]|nr:ATP-binding protein [Gammaproteobacteria bacterium]